MEDNKKITRRSLLDWVGKSVVISLSSQLLTACTTASREAASDCFKQNDGKGIIFEPGNGIDTSSCNWKENTIDPQDLVSILNSWSLRVDGLVNNPVTYSFNDLLNLTRYNQTADFHCVEGWSVPGVPWNGFHLNTLIDIVDPLPGSSHITFYAIGDHYKESIPIETARDTKTMMAFGINDSTIPLKHGFPLRLVIPDKYGYKSAKYIYRIEFTDEPVTGFWESYGYSYDADI